MKIRRKQILFAGLGSLGPLALLRHPGEAAEYNLKFSTAWTLQYYPAPILQQALDAIRNDTSGRVDIRLFPGSVLGGQAQEFAQLRLGAIDFATGQDNTIESVVPLAGIYSLPFIFKDAKEALSVAAGPFGKYRLAAISKANIFPFEQSWNLGLQEMVNQLRPIVTPDDMKGLKMRTQESKTIIAMFKALGSSATAISTAEIYTSLQTHIVEGLASPLAGIMPFKLYEVTKYVSYTHHVWTSFTLLANGDLWKKLPAQLRDTIDKRINEAAVRVNDADAPMNVTIEADLKKVGMVFNQANNPAFRDTLRRSGLYKQWREDYGSEAWALLEKSVGPLA